MLAVERVGLRLNQDSCFSLTLKRRHGQMALFPLTGFLPGFCDVPHDEKYC